MSMSKKKNLETKTITSNKPTITSNKPINPVSTVKKTYSSWYVIIVLIITFLAFSNSLKNKFVNWDDEKNIYTNELITSINKTNFWDNTVKIFSTTSIGNYNPLSIWTLAIDKMVHGMNYPEGFHLTNLLLHLLCTFLVFRLVLALKFNWQIAFITSLFFGIHPLRVESVTWIT